MKLIIPGEPVAQARMRHFKRGDFVGVFDPNAADKKRIREIIVHQMRTDYPHVEKFKYPHICFVFDMPIPKSTLKRDLEKYESGFMKHTVKPDVDNLVKLYLDCLDGICFDGDQHVSLGYCVKMYHKEPKTQIFIQETKIWLDEDEGTPLHTFVEVWGRSMSPTTDGPHGSLNPQG